MVQVVDSLLRKLPQSAELKQLLDEANDARTKAEDLLSVKEEECRWLRTELEKARAGEIEAVKTLANAGWQQRYGWRIYPDAPGIPEGHSKESQSGPIQAPMTNARMLQRKRAQEFREQGIAIFEDLQKKNGA